MVGFELMVESRFISDFLTKVSSFSEKKQRQPAVCPLIPENHTKEFRIRCLGISTTEEFLKDGDMSWTGPEGSQTLGCLLPPTVLSDFFSGSSSNLLDHGQIFHENHRVHPASQIIYLRREPTQNDSQFDEFIPQFQLVWILQPWMTSLDFGGASWFSLNKMSAVWLFISNRDGSMTVWKHSYDEKAAWHQDECLNPVLRVR